ncbi:MAG: S9 family peptidase [Candidatus Marsarchaeota archaeon]|nr:S9 family peptidase [Candidatus Marsarchaeota archaeon]
MPSQKRLEKWDAKTFTRFAEPSGVQISRDGDIVLYTVTTHSLDSDKDESTLVIKDLASHGTRSIANAENGSLSPSGSRFAFTRKGGTQDSVEVWVGNTGDASCSKAFEAKRVHSLSWNADDRRLLVVTTRGNEDPHFYYYDDTPYWFDDKGYVDSEATVASVYDSETGVKIRGFEHKHITFPGTTAAIWHGDDVIVNVPSNDNPFKRYSVLVWRSTGDVETLFQDVSWSAQDSNGKAVALLGKEKVNTHTEHSFVYKYVDGKVQPVTEKLGLDNADCRIDGEGNVYFLSASRGRYILGVASPDGADKWLVNQDSVVTSFDVSDDGKVAYIMESPTSPPEVYVYTGRATENISSYNTHLANTLELTAPSHFEFRAADGLTLDGWYYRPAAPPGAKLPVILTIHGGPKGMFGYSFNLSAQLYSSNGYVVVCVNPRGSDGYTEEFAGMVRGRIGDEDYADIMGGLDWVIRNEPACNPEAMAVTGISYGGFMTNWTITHTSRFKAAISENGVSNWFTSFAFSDIGLWFDQELVGGDPLTDPSFREKSPVYLSGKVQTPVLFIHSLEDYRCPLDQSLMFHHVLKHLGKESYLIVFKKGAHGHSTAGSPRHRMKRYYAILEFLRCKLVDGSAFNPNFPEHQDQTGQR